jgi:hypothetical protein
MMKTSFSSTVVGLWRIRLQNTTSNAPLPANATGLAGDASPLK